MKKWRIAIYSLNETPNFFLNNYNDLDHTNILCKCIWCLWKESIQNAWVKKCIWCVDTNSYISVHVYVLSRYTHIWHASMNTLIKCKRPIWKMIVVFLQIKLLRNRYLHEYPCANYMPILQRILQTLYYYILGIIAKKYVNCRALLCANEDQKMYYNWFWCTYTG